jgi:hypothetical protein
MAELKYGLISVDEHVQESPEVWTQRLSRARWGDRIPHIERQSDGTEHWVVDGQNCRLPGWRQSVLLCLIAPANPSWAEVPGMAYKPVERRLAMDVDGVDYAVLYPRWLEWQARPLYGSPMQSWNSLCAGVQHLPARVGQRQQALCPSASSFGRRRYGQGNTSGRGQGTCGVIPAVPMLW